MKYNYRIAVSVVIFVFCACRGEKKDLGIKKGPDALGELIKADSTRKVDLLEYLVKTEKIGKQDPYFALESASLYKSGENGERSISIRLKGNAKTIDDHYLFISIYPLDEELDLLEKERRKYGFEAFSSKLAIDEKNGLMASCTIDTHLNFARAVTMAILDYRTKQKSMEVVFKDVDLLN